MPPARFRNTSFVPILNPHLFSRTARADEGKERNLREKMMALVYLIISYAHEDRPLDPERLFTDGFFPLLDKTVGLFNNQENWRERSKYTYAIKHGIARSFCLVGEVLKDEVGKLKSRSNILSTEEIQAVILLLGDSAANLAALVPTKKGRKNKIL